MRGIEADPQPLPPAEPFSLADLRGEVAASYLCRDFAVELRRVIDPAAAEETLHWGRNYLYRASWSSPAGPVPVVVKQFRNHSLKSRLRKRWGESKAARSWRSARAFQAAGVPTAEPILLAESTRPEGPSFFLTRYLESTLEARYPLRALAAGTLEEEYPHLDGRAFLTALGRTLARMHAAGLFHRDLSIGNVLLQKGEVAADGHPTFDLERLYLIDLNRSRRKQRLGLSERSRDLCRLAVFDPEHQEIFLEAYWGEGEVTPLRRAIYRLYHRSFLAKIEGKKRLRGRLRSAWDALRPRSTHVHIPEAETGAGDREKIVWDHLSDQPHQHAGRLAKLKVRLADSGSHLTFATALAGSLPAVWRRYRELQAKLQPSGRRGGAEVPWAGAGVCLRPYPENPEALLATVEELGVGHLLLRLHPWDEDHRDELALAGELAARGHELVFGLPQNRGLVRDPARWRRKVEELVELFSPFGKTFQVGQAINRSKWGVWHYDEYLQLARIAREVLDRHEGASMLGPGVIDFELHATIGVLAMDRNLRFDALASLLYVDRRGAPENRQLGFDSVEKVLLARAIAEAAPNCAPRSWITEVNWPLREGPHSPAGKAVSVDEQTQADYLARFYLLTLPTGMVERVYWWQLLARGYGLAAAEADGSIRRRPSFAALATLERELHGTTFSGPLESPPGTHLYPFRHPDGRRTLAAWCEEGQARVDPPGPVAGAVGQGGESLELEEGPLLLTRSVRYFHLEAS